MGQRKKHGHLENMAGDLKTKLLKNQTQSYVESQIQKKLLNDMNVNLMKRNLDSLNLPTQLA